MAQLDKVAPISLTDACADILSKSKAFKASGLPPNLNRIPLNAYGAHGSTVTLYPKDK